MAYTMWGYYEYNDATGQFDTWVATVPGSTPPLLGETRDAYEARQLALQESLKSGLGIPLPLLALGALGGLVLLAKRKGRV